MNRPLRILQVNKAYYPHIGGIESLVRVFSREMLDRAEVKVLVCRDGRGKGFQESVENVPVTYAGSMGTYFSCPLSWDFIRKFRKMAQWADVIEMHMPFPLADVACLLSHTKKPVILAWHSDVIRQKTLLRFYKPILMRLLKRADGIIVATQGHIDSSSFLTQVPEKCRVIPYGIDSQTYLAVPRQPILTKKQTNPHSVKILFVGRFVYYKGIEVLIDAFAKTTGCELFLVGKGTQEMEDTLHSKIQAAQKEQEVHFLGNLSEEQLRQAFADCDFFVLPSVANSEAFGIVQLEAMVYGKPVINTALPTGVPFVSLHGETGMTVPPHDVDALAEAMMTLAQNADLREIYGKAAQKRVQTVFEEKAVVEQVYQTLKEFAERN